MAGVGRNVLVVEGGTKKGEIEEAFVGFMGRKDVAMVVVNQHIIAMVTEEEFLGVASKVLGDPERAAAGASGAPK